MLEGVDSGASFRVDKENKKIKNFLDTHPTSFSKLIFFFSFRRGQYGKSSKGGIEWEDKRLLPLVFYFFLILFAFFFFADKEVGDDTPSDLRL